MNTQPTAKITEVFYSQQGEGPYVGYPMVFIRFFGCNFTCKGFNNPNGEDTAAQYTDVMPTIGCDSIYSWHSKYKNLTSTFNVQQLVEQILSVVPRGKWTNPISGLKPILCFTGGEPTLHQKFLTAFISSLTADYYPELKVDKILFETNCAVPLREDFLYALGRWLGKDFCNDLIWSNSPKLKNSGEPREKAIVPKVVVDQRLQYTIAFHPMYDVPQIDQYFKFVSDGSEASFEEIGDVIKLYNAALPFDADEILAQEVHIMPEGATQEQQEKLHVTVAQKCLYYGYIYCARVHVWLYGNTKGT